MHDTNLCNCVSLMWRLCRKLTFNFSKCGFRKKKKIVYKLIYKFICTFQIFKKFLINFQFCLLEVINEKKVSVKVLRIICCMLCYIYPSPSPRFFFLIFLICSCITTVLSDSSLHNHAVSSNFTHRPHSCCAFCATIYVKITPLSSVYATSSTPSDV